MILTLGFVFSLFLLSVLLPIEFLLLTDHLVGGDRLQLTRLILGAIVGGCVVIGFGFLAKYLFDRERFVVASALLLGIILFVLAGRIIVPRLSY